MHAITITIRLFCRVRKLVEIKAAFIADFGIKIQFTIITFSFNVQRKRRGGWGEELRYVWENLWPAVYQVIKMVEKW